MSIISNELKAIYHRYQFISKLIKTFYTEEWKYNTEARKLMYNSGSHYQYWVTFGNEISPEKADELITNHNLVRLLDINPFIS